MIVFYLLCLPIHSIPLIFHSRLALYFFVFIHEVGLAEPEKIFMLIMLTKYVVHKKKQQEKALVRRQNIRRQNGLEDNSPHRELGSHSWFPFFLSPPGLHPLTRE